MPRWWRWCLVAEAMKKESKLWLNKCSHTKATAMPFVQLSKHKTKAQQQVNGQKSGGIYAQWNITQPWKGWRLNICYNRCPHPRVTDWYWPPGWPVVKHATQQEVSGQASKRLPYLHCFLSFSFSVSWVSTSSSDQRQHWFHRSMDSCRNRHATRPALRLWESSPQPSSMACGNTAYGVSLSAKRGGLCANDNMKY